MGVTRKLRAATTCFITLVASTHASALEAADRSCVNVYHFTSDELHLHVVFVHEFPFISGSVAGTRGRFMVDTGASGRPIIINDNYVHNLGQGTAVGTSFTGSGERFRRYQHACVPEITVNGAGRQKSVSNIESNNLAVIQEAVAPDFLGFLGWQAFSGYDIKLNYGRSRFTLYRARKGFNTVKAALKGEVVIARLPFTVGKLPNFPTVEGRLDGKPISVTFDTGQDGTLELTDEERDAMVEHKALVQHDAPDGSRRYGVANLTLPQGVVVSLPGLEVTHPHSHADAARGETADRTLTLGFQFFIQYRTLWAFSESAMYLLRP